MIIETAQTLIPIEIKSGETFNREFLNNLQSYRVLAKQRAERPGLVFGGIGNYVRDDVHVVGWREPTALIQGAL